MMVMVVVMVVVVMVMMVSRAQVRSCAHINKSTHTHTHTRTHTHSHSLTHTLTHSLTLTLTHSHSLTLTLTPRFLDRLAPPSALEQECMAVAKGMATNIKLTAYQRTKGGERAPVLAAIGDNLPNDLAVFDEKSKL